MELKIINKKEDPLLSRTIVESEIVFEKATPSRAEIKSNLSKNLGKDEKLIVVKGIHTLYGLKKAKNIAYIYENEEFLKRIEVKTKKGAKKKAPAEAEEKVEEKPQEPLKETEKGLEKSETFQKQAKKEESEQEAKQEEKPKAKAEVKQEGKKSEEQKEAKDKGK